MITQEKLKSIFFYNSETGIFTRKVKRGKWPAGEVCGTINGGGYVYISINGVKYQAHRLAWLYMYGQFPSLGLDHINCLKTDNRICNLRESNQSMNSLNVPVKKNSSTGLKGAFYIKSKRMFGSKARVNGKSFNLGYFRTKELAHDAYVNFANKHHGDFIHHTIKQKNN